MVPEEISAWKPESAPQAMVTNRNGNSGPDTTGPPAARPANSLTAGAAMAGCTTTIATASMRIVPIFMNVDR